MYCSIIIVVLCAQLWSPPVNIGIPGVDDLMHQADRQYHPNCNHPSCLVWQVNTNGNWDIMSRFSVNYWSAPYWNDTIRITTNSGSDINPTVATDYHSPPSYYWCVWQNDSIGNWDICIAKKEISSNHWELPYRLTADSANEEYPSVCIIHDTVWVVWQASRNGATNIFSRYYDGVSWSLIDTVTHDSLHINIHPKIEQRGNHPIVVWERKEDIYYSEYMNGNWQISQSICSDPANDNSPEIAVDYNSPYGVWITWQSNRSGHYEIYTTGYDSLNACHRLTHGDSPTSPYLDLAFSISPFPLHFHYLGPWRYLNSTNVAFSTYKNGNYDIYTFLDDMGYVDSIYFVDPDPAEDIEPVMCGDGEWAWVLWRTNREGDWDIYGSYINVDAIKETHERRYAQTPIFVAAPNPFNAKIEIRCVLDYSIQSRDSDRQRLNIKIFNTNGILVKNLELIDLDTSHSAVVWFGDDSFHRQLPAGVYFLVCSMNDASSVTKIVKVK
jgi:hypothetical protein